MPSECYKIHPRDLIDVLGSRRLSTAKLCGTEELGGRRYSHPVSGWPYVRLSMYPGKCRPPVSLPAGHALRQIISPELFGRGRAFVRRHNVLYANGFLEARPGAPLVLGVAAGSVRFWLHNFSQRFVRGRCCRTSSKFRTVDAVMEA